MLAHFINNSRRILLANLSIWLWVLVFPRVAWADAQLTFSVETIFPESQLEGITTYFDLNLDEGVEELLGLRVTNASSEAIEIVMTAHTAFTNVNGVVEYAQAIEELDPTLPFALGELLTTPEPLILEPGEVREVDISLTMPEQSFEGLLAGGIRIQEIRDDEVEAESFAIQNAFAYVIPVVVSNNRTLMTSGLDLLDVFADQLYYRNVFSATIQNYTSRFINQLEVEAEIRAVGTVDILYEAQTTGMQMAPNSSFHYPIHLHGNPFRSGDYVLTLIARSGEQEWSWEKTFTVDRETAREFNRQDLTVNSGTNWWMIGSVGLGVLLLLMVAYHIYKQQQVKNQMEQKKK